VQLSLWSTKRQKLRFASMLKDHFKSSKFASMWRDHVNDEEFIDCVKKRIRYLATSELKPPPDPALLERVIRRLSALEGVVHKAWEPRLRADFTSPLAMVATAGMWWAMLAHELAAVCGLVGGRLATGFARGATVFAGWVLPLAQFGMALYGAAVGLAGFKEARRLEDNLEMLEQSQSLGKFPTLQESMRYQVEALWVSNAAAEIVAGPALFLGQCFMALGGPTVLANVYVLALGALLSGISILLKTVVELESEKRFGYNDDALQVTDIILEELPASVSSYSTEYEDQGLALIQSRRLQYLRELAWLKAFALLHQTSRKAPAKVSWVLRLKSFFFGSNSSRKPSDGGLSHFLYRVSRQYSERYDAELEDMLQAIVSQAGTFFKEAIHRASDLLFMSRMYLAMLETERELGRSKDHSEAHDSTGNHSSSIGPVVEALNRAMHEWEKENQMGHLQSVLKGAEAEGLTGKLHQIVLEEILIRGEASKSVTARLNPFVEQLPCWEDRSFSVPGLSVFQFQHQKHAYRFRPDAVLAGLAALDERTPVDGGPSKEATADFCSPPQPSSSEVPPPHMRGGNSLTAEVIAQVIGKAAWKSILAYRKFEVRSQLGCLNEAFFELLRQHEMRTSLSEPVPA